MKNRIGWLATWVSVNWNWPGEISGTPPRTVQLLKGNAIFDDYSALNAVPGTLVTLSWNEPLESLVP